MTIKIKTIFSKFSNSLTSRARFTTIKPHRTLTKINKIIDFCLKNIKGDGKKMKWVSIYEAGGVGVVSHHIGKRARTKDEKIGTLDVRHGHFCVINKDGETIGLAEEIEMENGNKS